MSGDHVVPQKPIFDAARVQSAIRELLLGIGENPDREGLKDTPERVSQALQEIVGGLAQDPDETLAVTFTENHNELVLIKDIPLYSLCEHHLLVFHGVAHVGYIPALNGKVAGLSKLARLVDLYARRLQIQERLTSQIANAIVAKLQPRGVIVVIEAEHMCMAMRGICKPGTKTLTSAVRGIFQSSPAARAEALSLISS